MTPEAVIVLLFGGAIIVVIALRILYLAGKK